MRLQTTASSRHQAHLSQQRRSVLYISEHNPTAGTHRSPPSMLEEEEEVHGTQTLLESPRVKMRVGGSGTGGGSAPAMVLRIGLALLVFWLVILTVFTLSHILHDGPEGAKQFRSAPGTYPFVFPNASTGAVSLPVAAKLIQYRVCCWDKAQRFLSCDGSGLFNTQWDQTERRLMFHNIVDEFQGASCTLICK